MTAYVGGIADFWAGVATLDFARAREGFSDYTSALVPRYGYFAGPGHGLSAMEQGIRPRHIIDRTTLAHDRAYQEIPSMFSREATVPDLILINEIWTEHRLGPVGQAYRYGLTLAFGVKIAVQEFILR